MESRPGRFFELCNSRLFRLRPEVEIRKDTPFLKGLNLLNDGLRNLLRKIQELAAGGSIGDNDPATGWMPDR